MRDLLCSALLDTPPMLARDGGFIAEGYCPQLDKLRGLKAEARKHIAVLQRQVCPHDRELIPLKSPIIIFWDILSKSQPNGRTR